MKTVFVYCEGQTEESFINNILEPYFYNMNIYIKPIIHKTKRTNMKTFKGGVGNYYIIKKEIINLCKNPNIFVTTMFDYYGMPKDTPAINCVESDIYKKIKIIEESINQDIGYKNLFFNLVVHEFEGLLFSNPKSFSIYVNNNIVSKLQAIKDKALSPEHINNSINTAPSKRILNLVPDYSKSRMGIIISKKIGINTMIKECKHFSNWINRIKNI